MPGDSIPARPRLLLNLAVGGFVLVPSIALSLVLAVQYHRRFLAQTPAAPISDLVFNTLGIVTLLVIFAHFAFWNRRYRFSTAGVSRFRPWSRVRAAWLEAVRGNITLTLRFGPLGWMVIPLSHYHQRRALYTHIAQCLPVPVTHQDVLLPRLSDD